MYTIETRRDHTDILKMLFSFPGRMRFSITFEDKKMYFIFSVFPVTPFIKKGHVEYAYQSASCDFWNISIHQFCIERTCKNNFFFYQWLVIAYSYKRYRTTSLNERKRIDKSHHRFRYKFFF